MMINWKFGRLITIIVSLVSALLLTGIADAILGINLSYQILGIKIGTILGIGNFFSAWILYKVL